MASNASKKLFSAALSLPTRERADLAHELLRSLDESEDPDAAAAWLAEIERRAREVEAGTAELVDWAAVRQRLESRWRKRSG
jgi:putative addiction module component (TIGR02574 family)